MPPVFVAVYLALRMDMPFERLNQFYTITLRNFVVPTRSIWYVILFRETGVVHRSTYSFNYWLFTYVLCVHFILDIK